MIALAALLLALAAPAPVPASVAPPSVPEVAAVNPSGGGLPYAVPFLSLSRGERGRDLGRPHRATEAEVAAAARAAVAAIWPDAEVAVVRLSGRAAEAAPPLRVVFDEAAPRGRVSARVEHEADGAWQPAGWAYLDVAVFETVPVLTRDVSRDEPLADAVALQRVETTTLHDGLSERPGPDWLASRSLRAGTVLTVRHVRAPAAVEAGDPVRVRYVRGAVVITLDCQARERGAVGETIATTCPSARATRVRLTAPGAADWTATL